MSQRQVGMFAIVLLLGVMIGMAIFSGVMAFLQLPVLHGVRVV